MEAKKHAELSTANHTAETKEISQSFATETVAEDGGGKVVRSKGRTAALTLAKLAILSAISYILYMFVKFPLPMLFPSFLDLQISDRMKRFWIWEPERESFLFC